MFLYLNTHPSPWPPKQIRGKKPKPLILFSRDDEHLLIQHYCQSLNQDSPLSQPRSPAQILISLESEERGELERILADLEEENRWVFFLALSLVCRVHTPAHREKCQESSLRVVLCLIVFSNNLFSSMYSFSFFFLIWKKKMNAIV